MTPEEYQMIPRLLLVDSAGNVSGLLLEGNHGCAKTIDIVHSLLHEGNLYEHSNIHTGLATGSEHLHVLRVSSGRNPHLVVPYLSANNNPLEIRLYKNVQVSSYDGQAPVHNHNDTMPVSSWIDVFENAVVSSTGEEMFARGIYGSGNQSGSEYQFEADEWVLIGGLTYAVGVKNTGNQSVNYSIINKWAQP